jgi:hypothetical protein
MVSSMMINPFSMMSNIYLLYRLFSCTISFQKVPFNIEKSDLKLILEFSLPDFLLFFELLCTYFAPCISFPEDFQVEQ